MEYPFEMRGRTVHVLRAAVSWETPSGEQRETRRRRFGTREEAEAFALKKNGRVEETDFSEGQWMDGLEVADVPDTFGEAVRIFEMGQAAYEEELARPTAQEDTDAMLVDLDFRVTVLELGI